MDDLMTSPDLLLVVNNVWMLLATFLVFLMHLGFATLESGLTARKTRSMASRSSRSTDRVKVSWDN